MPKRARSDDDETKYSYADLGKSRIQAVQNADGTVTFSYVLNGQAVKSVVIGAETWKMVEALGLRLSHAFSNKGGAPLQGVKGFAIYPHTALMRSGKEAAVAEWRKRGATEEAVATMVVMHLNDCRLDFNVSNLMWAPQSLNAALQKGGKPTPRAGGKWNSSFRRTTTKCVGTPEEALHVYDVLKVTSTPAWMHQMMFMYGLRRPQRFIAHYETLETLQARAPVYVKRQKSKEKKRDQPQRFFIVELAGFSPIIQQLLNTENVPPFDQSLDVCVSYRGREITIDFLIERIDFEEHIKNHRGTFCRDALWYIRLGAELLHNVVLGRVIGAHGEDGLQGKHNIGTNVGRLDIRRRTLSVGDNESNQREKGRGYFFYKCLKMFRCDTMLDGKKIYLGVYNKEDDAKFASMFQRQNWKQLLQECEAFVDNNLKVGAHIHIF